MARSGANGWGRLLLSVILLVLPVSAYGQTGTVTIRIPSKPLAEALIDFALQAHISISDTNLDFRDAYSSPVFGTFARDLALAHLLEGSGFGYTFLDSGSARILPRVGAAPMALPPAETVIVTAAKREEIAQRLPASVVVAGGTALAQSGVQTAAGLVSQVAGMTATNLGPGQDKLFIRGLTDSILPGLSESMVGLYLDETRIADDAPDPDLRLIDVDRVEILRGPQGTLYGAGSLGGLVRIVTNKAEPEGFDASAHAAASVTESGAQSASVDAMLNIPVVYDRLGLRLVGYAERQGGYVDDERLGKTNTNRSDTLGGRASLAWQRGQNWSVSANLAYQQIRTGDSQYSIKGSPLFTRDTYLLEPHADNFLDASVTLKAALGGADLVSSTGLVDRRMNDQYDATLAWHDLTGYPMGPSPFDVDRRIRSLTHETRLVSTGDGRWQWLLGLYLSHRDEDFRSDLSGPNALGTDVSARMETREDRLNEAAIFGEVTYSPTSWISFTAGGRGFIANRKVSAEVTALTPPPTSDFHGTNKEPGFAPKLVLALTPRPNATFYAQYTQGYRLGGLNADGPAGAVNEPGSGNDQEINFDSDRLDDYELGLKWSRFDGRLVANSAIYYTVWRNVQTDQIAPDGAYFIVNAGTVRDIGAEFDLTATMFRVLSIGAHAFWNNSSLSHTNPIVAGGDGVLPGAPNFSAGAQARYDFYSRGGWDDYFALGFNYVGRSHLGFGENTPGMGGYRLTDIRIGFGRKRWSVVLFADNLFNDRGNTFAFGNPFNPGAQVTPPRPRTIGLSVSLN